MAVAMPLQNKIQSALVQSQPDVVRINFGGGYSQRSARGFNNINETMSVTWIGVTRAEMRTIQTAFDASKGVSLFSYIADNSTATKYWSLLDVSTGEPREGFEGGERLWTVSASFQREYDIIV